MQALAKMAARDDQRCKICTHAVCRPFSSAIQFKGVTSDCKPWGHSGTLLVCERCGHVQKQDDAEWQRDVAEIYANYDIYHLSGGLEQVLFEGAVPVARSALLLKQLQQQLPSPKCGHLLDVGCGNGALLRSFSLFYPQWVLAGHEQSDRYRGQVESIPGVAAFYTGGLNQINRMFDVVTLVHVLEHIPNPTLLMDQLRHMMEHRGRLFIEVPNCSENPFDFVIVDHCSHFTAKTLLDLVENAGFAVEKLATNWVPKEISLVLSARVGRRPEAAIHLKGEEGSRAGQDAILWLTRVADHARDIASAGNFGIFGTAIAGTWLANTLGEAVDFFIDEDPTRTAKTHMSLSVFQPRNAPKGSNVYLALPPGIAQRVKQRLQPLYPALRFVTPPL